MEEGTAVPVAVPEVPLVRQQPLRALWVVNNKPSKSFQADSLMAPNIILRLAVAAVAAVGAGGLLV